MDPIVTDASVEGEGVVETTGEEGAAEQEVVQTKDPRSEAMSRIVAARSGNAAVAETEGDDLSTGEEAETPDPGPEDDDFVTLEVSGQQIKKKKEEVLEAGVRTLQKETSADARLRQAAALEAELEERERRLKELEAEHLARRDQEDEEIDEESRAFADAIFTDEEAVAKTFSKLKKQLNTVTEKMTEAERERAEKQEKEQKSVVEYYHSNHKAIASDPDMHPALNRRLKIISEQEPNLSPIEIIDRAASEVYERFGVTPEGESSIQEQPPENPKKKMVKQPRPASARNTPPPGPKPKTHVDVLDSMRKARGQAA